MFTMGISCGIGAPGEVLKKDGGSLWFSVDFCCINELSDGDAYPLSLACASVHPLGFQQWFLAGGNEPRKPATQSICHMSFDLFHFRVMPFGFKGAPATFQWLMNHVLQSCLGHCCMVYIDDIILYSKDIHTHFCYIQRVFDCLQQAGLL